MGFKRWLAVLTAVVAPAVSQAYSHIVVFGDSLSDAGNNAILFGTDPGQVITGNSYSATLPYASGTYSNGDVWATYLGQSLGLPTLPSLAGGTNYAFGGAVTKGGITPSVLEQVSSYLGSGSAEVGDTLFIIAAGGNNARDTLEAISSGAPLGKTLLKDAAGYARDVGSMVDQLQAAGAEHLVVWNTPDLGVVPQVTVNGRPAAKLGSVVSNAYNNALNRRLSFEEGVQTFDIASLLRTAVANPGAYGFANVTDACGALPDCNPETYLFWDGIHPTSGGHRIIADQMLALVGSGATVPVPEPGVAWLMLGGLGVLVLRRPQADRAR